MVQLSQLYLTAGKTIALTIQIFVSKVMSLLFNMLSRFVIAFLPRSKRLLISWLQITSKQNIKHTQAKLHTSSSHWFEAAIGLTPLSVLTSLDQVQTGLVAAMTPSPGGTRTHRLIRDPHIANSAIDFPTPNLFPGGDTCYRFNSLNSCP